MAILAVPVSLHAAAGLTWDANTADVGVTDGTGVWNTTNTNWWGDPGANQSWVQGSDAQIGLANATNPQGTNTIITLMQNITVGNLFIGNDATNTAPVISGTSTSGTFALTITGTVGGRDGFGGQIKGNVNFTNGLTSSGTVSIGGSNDIGAMTITFNSGTDTITGDINLINGASSITLAGTTVTASGSTNINITGGTLDISSGTNTGLILGNINVTGGGIKIKPSTTPVLGGTFTLGAATLAINGGIYTGSIGTGTNQLNITGAATLTASTNAGTFSFNVGGVSSGTLGWGSTVGFNPGNTLTLNQAGGSNTTVTNAIDLNTGSIRRIQIGSNGSSLTTLSGSISDSTAGGGVEFRSINGVGAGGIWVLMSGGQSYTGSTVIGGTDGNNSPLRLILGASGSYSSSTYAITGTKGGQLSVNQSGTAIVSGNIITTTGTDVTSAFTTDPGATVIIGGSNTVNTIAPLAGTVIFTGTNTYVGNTNIDSGTLQIGNGGTSGQLPTGTGTVNGLANTALVFNRSDNIAISSPLTGAMSVVQAGTNMVTFTGATTTYTGATTINGSGTLRLGDGVTDGAISSGTIVNNGSLVLNPIGSANLAGGISGTGSLTMAGTGNQKISGASTYSGATRVNSGTLQLGSATAMGLTSNLSVASGATLNLSNGSTTQSVTFSGTSLALGANSTLVFGVGNNVADKLTISGNPAIVLSGTTTIVVNALPGANVTNMVIISAPNGGLNPGGTNAYSFVLQSLPALTSGSLTQTGTAIMLTFAGITTVYWEGGAVGQVNSWNTTGTLGANFSGDPTGATSLGGAMFGSAQAIVFSASNATSQSNTALNGNVTGASLTISDTNAVGISSGTPSSSTLTLASSGITTTAGAGPVTISANVALSGTTNITVNSINGLTFSGTLTGNSLIVNGANTLTFTGVNNVTNGVQLQSGTFNFNSDAALGSAAANVTFNGATNAVLQAATAYTGSRNFVFSSGTGTIDTQGNVVTLNGTLSGTGSFNKAGTGQLVVSGSNDLLTGAEFISAGTFSVLNPQSLATAGTSSYNIASGATMELVATTAQNFAPALNTITFLGNGRLLISGTGGMQFHNNATLLNMTGGVIEFAGGFNSNGGSGGNNSIIWANNKASLQIDSGAAFNVWDGNDLVIDSLLGSGTVTRTGYGNAGKNITMGVNGGSGTFAGTLTNDFGQINVIKSGTGTQTFSGSNGYSGSTAINAGTLRITSSTGLGFGGPTYATQGGQHTTTIASGATLDISGTGTVLNEAITLAGGSIINSGTGTTNTLDSGIAGITFNTDSNTLTGTMGVSIAGGSGTGAAATANTTGSFSAAGGNTANLFVQMTSAGSGYTPGSAPTVSITINGSPVGGTVLPVVSSVSMTGSNNFGGNGNLVINAQISGAGSLNKVGTGTLTLTGSQIYTGATNINNGVLAVNGSLAPNTTVTVGGASGVNTPTLGGGIGAANGGVLFTPTYTGGPVSRQVYTSSASIGKIGGSVVITGTGVGITSGVLAPGNSVGTITIGSLTMNAGSSANYEFNSSANDFTVVTGALSLNNVGFNLYNEGGTTRFSLSGTYALFSYGSYTLTGSLTVLNQNPNDTYTFINDTTNKEILLSIVPTNPNNSQLSITPSPIVVPGAVLVGQTGTGSATGTLTNTGTVGSGSADYQFSTTNSLVVNPSSSAGVGGTGATLVEGGTQAFTVSGGVAGSISGSAQTLGTISAGNLSNTNNAGNAGPVNVVTDIYDRAAVTPVNGGLSLTNSGVGSNGANSLIASAKIQTDTINNNANTQNIGNWSATGVGTIINPGGTSTIATLNPTGLLNGTYHATATVKVGNVTSSGSSIGGATTGDVLNSTTYALAGTVSGNKSSNNSDVYVADILSGSSYAGYNIGSSVAGTTHTNTGGGGTTVGSIAYGTASAATSLGLSFDSVPFYSDIARNSDILTLNGAAGGIVQTGVGNNGQELTDVFVLTLSYDLSQGGLAYILQDTQYGWINAVSLNSNNAGNSTFNPGGTGNPYLDDGGTSAKKESFTQYLLNNGGVATIGDYGYSNGVAWAVLDHTADPNGVTEFAVVAQAIPEPGTYAMFFSGFGLLVVFRRMRRNRATVA